MIVELTIVSCLDNWQLIKVRRLLLTMYPSESRLILEMTELNVEPRLGYNTCLVFQILREFNWTHKDEVDSLFCQVDCFMDSTTNLQYYLATSFHVCGVGWGEGIFHAYYSNIWDLWHWLPRPAFHSQAQTWPAVAPFVFTHPPPPVPLFLLTQNLSPQGHFNPLPTNDAYMHHAWDFHLHDVISSNEQALLVPLESWT